MTAIYWVAACAFYFLPTFIASARLPPEEADKIAMLNILLGWSGVGWVVALATALNKL